MKLVPGEPGDQLGEPPASGYSRREKWPFMKKIEELRSGGGEYKGAPSTDLLRMGSAGGFVQNWGV